MGGCCCKRLFAKSVSAMGIEDVVVSEWRVSQSVLTNPMHFLEKTEKNAVGIGILYDLKNRKDIASAATCLMVGFVDRQVERSLGRWCIVDAIRLRTKRTKKS